MASERLTIEQRGALNHTRICPGHAGYLSGNKMAMMRRLKDRGLVRESARGFWFITDAGRAALAAAGAKGV